MVAQKRLPRICCARLRLIRTQFLEELIGLHKVYEALKALAFLVDFLILAASKQLFLDSLEQHILRVDDVSIISRRCVLIGLIAFILFLREQAIDELFERAPIILVILLVLIADQFVELRLQREQNRPEADQVRHDCDSSIASMLLTNRQNLFLVVRNTRQNSQDSPLEIARQHVSNN